MIKFTNEPIANILDILSIKLKELESGKVLEFEVLNPDLFNTLYSGTNLEVDKQIYIYRTINSWVDLAQILYCKMLVPKIVDDKKVIIRYKKLDLNNSFHLEDKSSEKYGIDSQFNNINKNEEPEISITYLKALKNVNLEKRLRVLNLGINSGSEFEIIKNKFGCFSNIEFIGIDYCKSAIDKANELFKEDKNCKFYCHDINDLNSLNLGVFDLIISIGTFQSSNLNFNEVFMSIVQNHLKKDGAMILGFPNCRWLDGELIYGAKAANYSYSEMSVLYKDVMFCKKYLQQKKFRVTLTGKYYTFLTATSIRK